MPDVRPERTDWRDQHISARHRLWGYDCPCLDIDFLLLEYERARPAALVEYKHERASEQDFNHPTYQALIYLGNQARIPFFVVRYAQDWSRWEVTPLNDFARKYVPQQTRLTEKQYITLLYRIRGREVPQNVLERLAGEAEMIHRDLVARAAETVRFEF